MDRVERFFRIVWFGVGLCALSGVAQQIPKTSFSCDGRTSGYYADVSTGCQVYHMCDGLGRQFSYRCPSKTLFQQRMLICDHWYMVNCSKAEEDYSANLLIGQQGRAFVEDLQFHRTPRPDLADPVNSDYNMYRPKQLQGTSSTNIVGADTGDGAERQLSTDQPEYYPPSHWSTQFSAPSTTPAPNRRQETESAVDTTGFIKQIYYKTTYNAGKSLSPEGTQARGKELDLKSINKFNNRVSVESKPKINNEKVLPDGVNFPSSFQATTPVYPKHVDIDLSKFTDFGNPLEGNVDDSDKVSVNFPSKFQATTPVYPDHVDVDSSRLSEFDIPIENDNKNVESVIVNFASDFKATTPVYPLHVDFDPSKLSEFDFPIDSGANGNVASVNFDSKFKATTPVYPKQVDVDLSKYSGTEELPPDPVVHNAQVRVNFASNFKATTPVYPQHVDVDLSKFLEPVELPKEIRNDTVNFGSDFKATTPVYPQTVEATSPIPEEFGLLPPHQETQEIKKNQPSGSNHQVNFASNFQATTPVYPKSVESTSPDPSNVGLLAPKPTAESSIIPHEQPSIDIQPPSFDSTFKRRIDEDDPSVLGNTFSNKQLTEFMLTIKPEQLKDLKQMWHIPDYDFPLDTASRPSYEVDFSSFQAIPTSRSKAR